MVGWLGPPPHLSGRHNHCLLDDISSWVENLIYSPICPTTIEKGRREGGGGLRRGKATGRKGKETKNKRQRGKNIRRERNKGRKRRGAEERKGDRKLGKEGVEKKCRNGGED